MIHARKDTTTTNVLISIDGGKTVHSIPATFGDKLIRFTVGSQNVALYHKEGRVALPKAKLPKIVVAELTKLPLWVAVTPAPAIVAPAPVVAPVVIVAPAIEVVDIEEFPSTPEPIDAPAITEVIAPVLSTPAPATFSPTYSAYVAKFLNAHPERMDEVAALATGSNLHITKVQLAKAGILA